MAIGKTSIAMFYFFSNSLAEAARKGGLEF